MKNPFRIGPNVYLRPIELEDAERLQRWINDPEVHRWLLSHRPWTAGMERKWIESQGSDPGELCLMTVARDGDVPIGSVGLHRIGGPSRSAVFGIMIGEKDWQNRGLGTEATHLVVRYGFDTLNLHRIELQVYASNVRARRVYERVGFRAEGVRREARFWNGEWEDVIVMGLLEREWRASARTNVRSETGLCAVGAAAEPWPGSG